MFPEAKLIYNDTNNHMYGALGIETTKLIANALHEQGLIDYVGAEMHMPGDIPNKEEIIEIFQSYPVPVVITEFDALLTEIPEDQKDARLNEITKTVFDACLESEVCHSITLWGESDSNSWGERSTLRDTENNRKQAYYIALQSMFEHIP
jgi:GH35 family endo-1,4-beta-xylanase